MLVVCLGMNLMAMGRTLLVVYLAIEMVSLASFVLAGFRFGGREGRRSNEAALKYVVYGGVSSGVMLYGMSWLYGAAQSIALPDIAERVAAMTREQGHMPNAIAVGVACVTAGFAYKIAAAPFHMWVPDVYEGAPTLVAAFLSVGPKAAGFAVLLRFFREGFGAQALLPEAQAPWPILIGAIGVVTMTIGNLSALGQTNLKRLLAYSSIAHAGTMLLAFAVPGDEGIAAIAFYLVAYCAMNLGAFLVVLKRLRREREREPRARHTARGASANARRLSARRSTAFGGSAGARRSWRPRSRCSSSRSSGSRRSPGSWGSSTSSSRCSVEAGTTGAGTSSLRCAACSIPWFPSSITRAFCARCTSRSSRLSHLRPSPIPAPHGEGGPVSVPDCSRVRVSGGRCRLQTSRDHLTLAALVVPTVFLGVWWGPLYDFVTRTVTMIP